MSNLLTMEDFEDTKQSRHNMSSFDMLLKVVSVAAKKYDAAKRAQTQVKEKRNPLRFVIIRRNGEGQNLTSYAIKKESDDENSIIEGRPKVMDSETNQSSGEADTLKRKLKETISNEEWIRAMETKRRKQKDNRNQVGQHNPPPTMAEEFQRKIMNDFGGKRITRVIQKSLTATDVSRGHGRVTIPCSQIETFRFLDDDEMTHLRLGKSITVPLIHMPRRNGAALPLIETPLELKQWDLHKEKNDPERVSYTYALRTNWNVIVSGDELEERDVVQIWAFREVHNRLCMALVKL